MLTVLGRQDNWSVALTRPATRTESSRNFDPLAWHSAGRTVLSLSYSRTTHLPPPPESAKDRRETATTQGKTDHLANLKPTHKNKPQATQLVTQGARIPFDHQEERKTIPATTRNNHHFETNPATTSDDHQEKDPSLWGGRRRAKVTSSCTKDFGHHLLKKEEPSKDPPTPPQEKRVRPPTTTPNFTPNL
ncbi:hypothetical protein LIER_38861 [Lithospermum erythrorhizon]|uniref:Uncharacterized protein n=1 Tax=Lithospermum erythrorhizon TaxID=34254 RepID=A0AAV3Q8W1_LITER